MTQAPEQGITVHYRLGPKCVLAAITKLQDTSKFRPDEIQPGPYPVELVLLKAAPIMVQQAGSTEPPRLAMPAGIPISAVCYAKPGETLADGGSWDSGTWHYKGDCAQ